ncbi:hypothetical protein EWM64_g835 [Hericium alpestre]|uniref:Mid2 domain-containing protein n=1 Tax=Hericium alpestre TaxID=135208 RepID=A0A4Z0A9F9_9AGAM|nr:hypothetical protein EWM64_g835 [Hericium alpestre]
MTQTTLLFTSIPTPSSPASATVTDPDAPATTLSVAGPSGTAAPVSAPLPNDIPARIYPPQPIPQGTDLSQYTLISILFDSSLPWIFVAGSGDSQAQLLSWLPTVLQGALPITQDQIKTFALQVYIPDSYTGPSDRDQLMTTWLGYIPTEQVNTLANEIKVKSSQFYTGSPAPYSTLAGHVNPAYSLRSISNPNEIPGGGGATTGNSNGSVNGGSSSNHSRQDAIIGVVSVLGGITLIVLAVLIFRSVKRRRELAHRRLSDPNLPHDPYPDRAGRDFDQDSVGGQRRRSFYFAEDSLRGASGVSNQAQPGPGPSTMGMGASTVEYSYRNSPDETRERRPVMPNAISAPILQQSSMNW